MLGLGETMMVYALGFYCCLFPPGTNAEACPDHHGETSQNCEQDGHLHGAGFPTHCKCLRHACVFPRRLCPPHTNHIALLLSTGTGRGNYPLCQKQKHLVLGFLSVPLFVKDVCFLLRLHSSSGFFLCIYVENTFDNIL